MSDKPHSNPFSTPFAATDFLQLMSAAPLVEIQRRNMEAMSKSATKISEAMASVAGKQMAAFSDLSSMRPPEPINGPGDLAGFFAAQARSGRQVMEKAIADMREASDTMRHCWYEVASEFESCARQNASLMEEQLKKSSSDARTRMGAPAQARKAAAE